MRLPEEKENIKVPEETYRSKGIYTWRDGQTQTQELTHWQDHLPSSKETNRHANSHTNRRKQCALFLRTLSTEKRIHNGKNMEERLKRSAGREEKKEEEKEEKDQSGKKKKKLKPRRRKI